MEIDRTQIGWWGSGRVVHRMRETGVVQHRHCVKAVKKINIDRFLLIRLILSLIYKNFNLSIVIDFLKISNFFNKSNIFGENEGKNFWGS